MNISEVYTELSKSHRVTIRPKDLTDYKEIVNQKRVEINNLFENKPKMHLLYLCYYMKSNYPYLCHEVMAELLGCSKVHVIGMLAKLNAWKMYDDILEDLEKIDKLNAKQ